jgi:two-component system, OmpR family, response regulator
MKTPAQVLIVDDEPEIRSLLRQALEGEGYSVTEASGPAELLRILEAEPVNLVTLDLNLGGDDGLELARQIRTKGNVPIIMITAKGSPEERIIGFESGADDYIAKPFHIREVLLRVRSVLGRYAPIDPRSARTGGPGSPERYQFETGVLDISRRELRSATGDLVELTDAELDLLAVFLRRPKRILSREEMMQLLKGRSWSPLQRALDGHVARLRKKIESPGEEAPRLIKSVRGVGYVFTGDVVAT